MPHQLRTPLTALRLKLGAPRPHTRPTVLPAIRRRRAGRPARHHHRGAAAAEPPRPSRPSRCRWMSRPPPPASPWLPLRRVGRGDPLGATQAVASVVPTATEQILDNFIDNALSVSPRTTIVVRVESKARRSYVSIRAPGLAGELRSRLRPLLAGQLAGRRQRPGPRDRRPARRASGGSAAGAGRRQARRLGTVPRGLTRIDSRSWSCA
jgi:hypothetical protein